MANALCDWSLQLAGGRDIPVAMPTPGYRSAVNQRLDDSGSIQTEVSTKFEARFIISDIPTSKFGATIFKLNSGRKPRTHPEQWNTCLASDPPIDHSKLPSVYCERA